MDVPHKPDYSAYIELLHHNFELSRNAWVKKGED
jgi:hypothetical protein